MSNQPTDKIIYTTNQNILIPLRKVLSIARHKGSIKFATIEAIFIRTINDYLTTQINCVITIPRKELLNKIKTSDTERLPLTVTYNGTQPEFKTIIDKNWHIL